MTPAQLLCGLRQRLYFDRKSASYQRIRVHPDQTSQNIGDFFSSRNFEDVHRASAMHRRSRF